jgi:ethanolaminephosphotransferase
VKDQRTQVAVGRGTSFLGAMSPDPTPIGEGQKSSHSGTVGTSNSTSNIIAQRRQYNGLAEHDGTDADRKSGTNDAPTNRRLMNGSNPNTSAGSNGTTAAGAGGLAIFSTAPSSSTGDTSTMPQCHEYEFFFLSTKAAKQLPHFQYRGQDLSLLYKYVLAPLATFCVDHLTPRWLAPNAITLIGLLFMVMAYVCMWYYSPTLEPLLGDDSTPRWIFLFNAMAMLIYQTLDNMDGRQARRTGSGSPLGLLFDHGCDAVNSVFGSANWIISMALHPVYDAHLCASMLMGPFALFYFGTWEEYFTGELVLPILNGPSEGLTGGACMSLISWWFGPQIWHGTQCWDSMLPLLSSCVSEEWLPSQGLRNADCLVLVSTYAFIVDPLGKTISVVRKYGWKTLLYLIPYAVLLVCTCYVGFIDLNIWLEMPRTSLHLCAGLFVEMTVDLMISHMTEDPYQYLRWPLIPLVGFTTMVGTGVWSAGQTTAEFLLVYSSMVLTYLCLKSVITVHEICQVLGIWCFDITNKRTKKVKPN